MRVEFQEAFSLLGWGLDDFISFIERMPTDLLSGLRREFDDPEESVPERHRFMYDAGRKCVDFELGKRVGR